MKQLRKTTIFVQILSNRQNICSMKYDIPTMAAEATSLLKSLISIPSLSREETQAADFLQNYIEMEGILVVELCDLEQNGISVESPAEHILKPGDYITAVNGAQVTAKEDLQRAVAEKAVEKLPVCLCVAGEIRAGGVLKIRIRRALVKFKLFFFHGSSPPDIILYKTLSFVCRRVNKHC